MIKPTNYSGRDLKGIFDQLYAEKSTMANHHQEINYYFCPSFSDVTQLSETPGRKKGQNLYTGIGGYCINKLARAIHGALTSSAAQWFNMRMSSDEIMEIKKIADWFSECSAIQFEWMMRSNFPNEIMKFYKALIGYGTANINTDEHVDSRTQAFDKLRYETWSVREFVFAEGSDELPTMVMRRHRLTSVKAMERWENHPRFKGLGKTAQGAFDAAKRKFTERHEYLEVFFKRTQYIEEKGIKRNWRHMPWGYTVVDYKDAKKIVEGGQMEQNNAVGRWEKNADDIGWGRGPAMEALPTMKTLNDVRKGGIKALAKDLNPPLVITHRGVIGNVRTHSGGIIYKKKGAELDTLESGSRYDAAQLEQQELKQEVKDHFLLDMIEMMPNESKTLGEFQTRYEMMMRLLGPTYGRLTYDTFNPTLFATFNKLLRNGKFPPMPQELVDIVGNPANRDYTQMDVEYTGPLARSQRLGDIGAIKQSYMDAAEIAEMTGSIDAFDHLDDDKAMELSMDLRGVPSEIRVSMDDIKKARDERQQRIAEMQETEQAGAEAETTSAQADAAGKVIQLNRGQAPA